MVDGAWISRPVFSRHGVFSWLLGSVVTVRYTVETPIDQVRVGLLPGPSGRGVGVALSLKF